MASQSDFGDIASLGNERLFSPRVSKRVLFDEAPACDLLTWDLTSRGPDDFCPFPKGYALVGRPSSPRIWRSSGHITPGLPARDQMPSSL